MPTILVVDDQPQMIGMVAEWLRRHHYGVLSATSGEEAIRLAVAHQPDLILLDVMMPQMDGIEVCRRLRSHEHTSHIPVVLMTAYDPLVGQVEALKAGATDYIAKPFALEDLERRMRSLLAHEEDFADQSQHLLDETVHAALTLVPCNLAWLLVIDPQRAMLVGQSIASTQGHTGAQAFLGRLTGGSGEFAVPLDPQGGLLVRVALNGKAELNLALSSLRDSGERSIYEACTDLDLYFVSVLPLHLSGTPLGALLLGSREPRDVETTRGQQVLAAIATQAAAVVNNVRLMHALARREAQNRRERAFRQSVLDTMSDGLLVYDAEGTIRFANRRLGLMTGYEVEALIGTPLKALFDPQDHARLDVLLAAPSSGQTSSLEVHLRRTDGRYLPVLAVQAASSLGVANERVMVITDLSVLKSREKELTRQAQRLGALSRAGQAISSSLALDETIQAILQEATSVVGASEASVLLLLPGGRELGFHTGLGPYADLLRNVRIPITKGVAGYVVREGRSVILSDAYEDERFYPGIDALTGMRTRSLAAVPLIVEGQTIGVLEVINKEQGDFDEDDREILESLARSAAIAIRNARLYDVAQRRVRELTVLLRASETASSTLAVEQVLEVVAHQLIDALAAQWCAISLWDKEQDRLQRLAEAVDIVWPAGEGYAVDLSRSPRAQQALASRRALLLTAQLEDGDEPLGSIPAGGFSSRLLVPIVIGKRAVGLAELYRGREQLPASEKDRQRCEAALARWAATLNEAEQWDSADRLRQLGQVLRQTGGAAYCTLLAYHPDGRSLLALHQHGSVAWPMGQGPSYALDTESLRRVALIERTPVSMRLEPENISPTDRIAFPQTNGIVLIAPLIAHSEAIGLVELIDADPTRTFSDDDLSLAQTIGNLVGNALENARLYAALVRRAAQLEAAYNDLQEADRLKEEWIQNVSHELRTPLTSIVGYADLLFSQDLGPLTEEQQKALHIVREQSNHLAEMVENLLTIQKMEREPLNRALVSLGEVAEEAVRDVLPQAAQANVEIVTEFGDPPPQAWVDADLMKQVFKHLLENAIKFSPHGGQVTVRLEDMGIGIRAEVVDQGIGIPPSEHGKIWRRFYQIDGSMTRSYGGAGLGLAIVKEVVEKHNGHVDVISAPGEGSRFLIILPKVLPQNAT